MKYLKKILFAICLVFLFLSSTHAAGSISISASSNYVTKGSKVTFYIYGNNVASWSISGHGIGATSGCSFNESDVSGTGENVNKTIASVTCTATDVGSMGIVVTGNVSSASGTNIVTTNVNTSKSVTVQKPREKDTNNYLSSIGVKGYSVTPSFNKETLEYSVNVPSTVDKITIEAAKESSYASLSGTGEFEVNEGANTFEVNVTSETGVPRVYKVTVNVEDENPIIVKIDGNDYTIMKNAKTLEKPTTYEATTVKIKEFDIPAFYSEISKFTLVGVKDTKGTSHFVIYDKEKNTYQLYNENKSMEQLLYIEPISDEKDGFTKKTMTINSMTHDVFVSNIDENIILVKAMNIKTGEIHLYQYDQKEGTYIIYSDTVVDHFEQEIEKYKTVILYFAGGLGVSLLLIVLLLFRRPRQKKKKKEIVSEVKVEKVENKESEPVKEEATKLSKKEKKKLKKEAKKQNQKEEVKETVEETVEEKVSVEKIESKKEKKKNRTKEDALKQVSDAASIIEEYEKTIQLNKKDLEKKKKEMEEQEQTMYNLFEGDKKKKKRKE